VGVPSRVGGEEERNLMVGEGVVLVVQDL